MANKAKRGQHQPSRRVPSLTTRHPDLPGPTPEQLAAAVKATKEHQIAPEWDATALEPFHTWLSALGDPFAEAYLETFPRPGSAGEPIQAESGDGDRLRALAPDAVVRFIAGQETCLATLIAAIENVDPAPLLAGMMFLTRTERWGQHYEPHAEPRSLDLELVAAIVSGLTYDQRRPATVADLRAVCHTARELSYWAQAVALAHGDAAELDARAAMRRELLQRWLTWRGSALPNHARALARTLASRMDSASKSLGFSARDLFEFTTALERRWEQLLTPCADAFWAFARSVAREEPAQLGSASPRFQEAFMTAAMLMLPSVLSVPAQGGSILGDAQKANEQAIIGALGMRPGTGQPVKKVLTDPPQRSRPFLLLPQPLETADDNPAELALLVNPGALSTEAHLTVEALMSRTFPKWPAMRAQAVDDHTAEIIRAALPGARVYTNLYIDGPAGPEMDGLVVYEDIVIVIEGKGAPLKIAARRGSIDRLVGQLHNLVAEGYRQLERDRAYVLDGRPARFYNKAGDCVCTINGADVRRCYQLMPTLDGFADLGAALPRLADLQVLPPTANPWIVGLTDLQVVADVLDRPAHFVAYMDFRLRWANESRLVTVDERELLNLFLYQVDLPGRLAQLDGNGLLMHAANQAIYDDWYAGLLGLGPIAPKPRIRATKRVRRFVDELARLRPNGWLASASSALQLPLADALAIDRGEVELAARARREGLLVGGDQNTAVVVRSGDETWPPINEDVDVRNAFEIAPLVCVFRQHGARITLEDVRYSADHDRHVTAR